MDSRMVKLQEMGCDVSDALVRFLDDEDFYLQCYEKVMEDPCFTALGQALNENNIKEAFEQAHTLKGIVGNMGLNSLYDILDFIVSSLRNGIVEGMHEKYEELIAEQEKYKEILL